MNDKVFELTSQRDAAAKSFRKLRADRKRDWGLAGISTGIHDINLAIGGFLPKKVVVFAARSGIGKTGILNSFIEGGSTVREGRRGAYLVFSWELDPSLLVTREICRKKGITQGLLLNGAKLIGDDTMSEIEEIYKECAGYDVRYQTLTTNIEIVDKITREFVKECKEKSKEEGVDIQPIVLLDFVQMSKGLENTLKTYQLQEFMVGAKNLANETDSTIVMLAQLKRESDTKDVPTRDDLSDSKSIEDNCDSLGLLHRPEYNNIPLMVDPRTGGDISTDGKMLVRILKERNFGTKDFIINCDIKHFRFWSADSEWGEDFHHLYNKKAFWMSHFGFKKNNEKQLNLDQN
jgi:replicative DNA helicase